MITNYKAAKAAGETLYFARRPCKRGHRCGRYVSTRQCFECVALHRRENAEKHNAACRAWALANPERDAAAKRAWKAANPDRVLAQARKDRKKWRKRHPHVAIANARARDLAKKRRCPAWADLKAIAEFYRRAAEMRLSTGEAWHVDHIIPLCGETVSGLHVVENLRVVRGAENLRKSNKFEPYSEAA